MIKKIILWLWLSVISFIGFTNAKVQDVWLLKYPSTLDQNFSIWFIKGGGVLTDFLWSTKSVVALDTNTIFWWATNWMPYFYSEWVNTIQWFFDRYFSCDTLTTIDTLPDNCQLWWIIDYSWDLQSTKEIFKNFFSNVVADDLAYYNYINNRYVGGTLSYIEQWLEVCWSSEIIWKSLCFRGWTCGASSSSHCNWFLGGWQLTNSQNLSNLSFWNVSNNWIWYAPWQKWYDWDYSWSWNISDSSSQWSNVSVWWNVVYWQCTNWQALQWYRNYIWINDYVCYWWLDDFSIYTWDYLVTPWKWLTVFDMYEWDNSDHTYSGFNDWLQSWAYNYEMYLNWQWLNPFDMYPTVFKTYFGILYRTFWPSRDVHDYCRLLLNSDLNWNLRDNSYIPSYVKDQLCEKIVNDNNISNPWQWTNSSWTVVSSDWSWIWSSNVSWSNLSWWTPVYDWTDFINNYFNKLKWTYSNPTWSWNWILPWFIVIALLGVMFFKFIRK